MWISLALSVVLHAAPDMPMVAEPVVQVEARGKCNQDIRGRVDSSRRYRVL